jgi:hypothetical protein
LSADDVQRLLTVKESAHIRCRDLARFHAREKALLGHSSSQPPLQLVKPVED